MINGNAEGQQLDGRELNLTSLSVSAMETLLGPVARTPFNADRQLNVTMLRLRRPAVAQAGGALCRLTDG